MSETAEEERAASFSAGSKYFSLYHIFSRWPIGQDAIATAEETMTAVAFRVNSITTAVMAIAMGPRRGTSVTASASFLRR